MSCKNANLTLCEPVLSGFPFSLALQFKLGYNPLDTALYDASLAVKAINTNVVVFESIPMPDGMYLFSLTANQTLAMTSGEWLGQGFIENKTSGYTSHFFELALIVRETLVVL